MPVVLRNMTDGERITSFQTVDASYVPQAGEVVLSDAEWEQKQTWLWSSAISSLRQTTAADRLRIRKREKEVELRDAHNAWINANLRTAELVIVSNKDAKGTAMTAEETQIRDTASSQYTRLKNLITQTRATTTVAQVDAIVW